MNLESLTVWIVVNGLIKKTLFPLSATSVTSALEVILYIDMHYINLRSTYLLTYLLVALLRSDREG